MLKLKVIKPTDNRSEILSISSCSPKKKLSKYTLEIFLERAKSAHGSRYDYSKITPAHIKGVKSHIPITCNDCGFNWEPTIDTHVNKKTGCPQCAGNLSWTYEKFMSAAKSIHGDRFDYSEIKPHMVTNKCSSIPVTCNICLHHWNVAIHNHITNRNGCPGCSGHVPWTYERFCYGSYKVHQDKFNYSEVTPEMVTGVTAKIPVKCNTCQHKWNPSIYSHLYHQTGCPECSKRLPWTYDRFIRALNNIHGSKYNHRKIDPHAPLGKNSKVDLICNTCEYAWSPTINVLMNQKSGCPNCANNAPWTYKRFMERVTQMSGDKYNYSLVKESDIKNKKSRVQLICNECDYQWESSVDNHVNGVRGCPNCSNRVAWTYQPFIKRAYEIHGDLFDYSVILPDEISNNSSRVTVLCNQCCRSWTTSVDNHINGKRGCPICKSSKGEKECIDSLSSLSIEFEREMVIDTLPRKRYDFMFRYDGKRFLLEFDGKQHFEPIQRFDKDHTSFENRQTRDILKTLEGLKAGYNIIRIDYTKIGYVKEHIVKALKSDSYLYLSEPGLYSYIADSVK